MGQLRDTEWCCQRKISIPKGQWQSCQDQRPCPVGASLVTCCWSDVWPFFPKAFARLSSAIYSLNAFVPNALFQVLFPSLMFCVYFGSRESPDTGLWWPLSSLMPPGL